MSAGSTRPDKELHCLLVNDVESLMLPLLYPHLPLLYPQLPLLYPQLPLLYPQLPLLYHQLPLLYPQLPHSAQHHDLLMPPPWLQGHYQKDLEGRGGKIA